MQKMYNVTADTHTHSRWIVMDQSTKTKVVSVCGGENKTFRKKTKSKRIAESCM